MERDPDRHKRSLIGIELPDAATDNGEARPVDLSSNGFASSQLEIRLQTLLHTNVALDRIDGTDQQRGQNKAVNQQAAEPLAQGMPVAPRTRTAIGGPR